MHSPGCLVGEDEQQELELYKREGDVVHQRERPRRRDPAQIGGHTCIQPCLKHAA